MYGMTLDKLALPQKTGGTRRGLLTQVLWGRDAETGMTIEMQVAPPISIRCRAEHGETEFGVFSVYATLAAVSEKHRHADKRTFQYGFILPQDWKAAREYFPEIEVSGATYEVCPRTIKQVAQNLRDAYDSLVKAQKRLGLAWN